ncbi:hypothetical protein RFF05_05370 [Bengtsoniella intestinalis]|uniref:hypothetical protein n=1 Tax=Bengtsoniella intestinalis TaxID=3073143 RepID=UPI00391F817A
MDEKKCASINTKSYQHFPQSFPHRKTLSYQVFFKIWTNCIGKWEPKSRKIQRKNQGIFSLLHKINMEIYSAYKLEIMNNLKMQSCDEILAKNEPLKRHFKGLFGVSYFC